ncbi:hypothetical protein PSTG_14193 [Puccinia striiformis f. sp. tritici PST-78]|uniref:Uncharacterized protein n=1 Tax=Puccinia striiformis f. sp. tritici PST-78 TaxID=1165861 RepID=A0A0L0UZG6_9BASI|nr:hypothetical protein PSTG_14193 [Puccinia striiformis f. sp. tritici PST-78]
MEALIFEIHNFESHHVISDDDEGQMNAIFFAHPNSLTLARDSPLFSFLTALTEPISTRCPYCTYALSALTSSPLSSNAAAQPTKTLQALRA